MRSNYMDDESEEQGGAPSGQVIIWHMFFHSSHGQAFNTFSAAA